MGERTGAGSSPSVSGVCGDDRARIVELLNSEAWEKRLDEARRQREKALAAKAAQAKPAQLCSEVHTAPATPGQGAARVVAALRALREAEAGAVERGVGLDAPFRQVPPAPPPMAEPNRPVPHAADVPRRAAASAPQPAFGQPPAMAAPVGPGPALAVPMAPRLETALARARAGQRDAAAPARDRSRWTVLVAGAFGMGLAVGIGAMQLPALLERAGATLAKAPAPAAPASVPAPVAMAEPPRTAAPGAPPPAPPLAEGPAASAPVVAMRIAAPMVPATETPVETTAFAERGVVGLPVLLRLRTETAGSGLLPVAPGPPERPAVLTDADALTGPAAEPAPAPVLAAAPAGLPGFPAPGRRPVVTAPDEAAPQPPARPVPVLAARLVPLASPEAEPAPRHLLAVLGTPAFPSPAPQPALPEPGPAGFAPPVPQPIAAVWSKADPGAVPAATASGRALPRVEAPGVSFAVPRAPHGRLDIGRPPDPQPAAAPPPPRPPVPDVLVSVYAPSALAEDTLGALTETLTGVGYRLADPARVQVRLAETDVRYFHRGDAAAAETLAAEIGAVVRDFTDLARKPLPGRLELWLAGPSRAPAQVAKPVAIRRSAQPTDAQIAARLKTRLIRKLRQAAGP
ncbi:hypothetical protein EV655_10868 [Rhodovulum euryhalinum]|uniref:Uncharacterized protein n=2 Tax=Rhodovulum euryhalinum TaxID=35805 RepID=A0A4R2KF35_9RHOB|nr:hypothetical protein EV655_10868 [Rhodovulum euryhalinum]